MSNMESDEQGTQDVRMEERWGSVSKLINTLGSLAGLPSLSLYTGASANITN